MKKFAFILLTALSLNINAAAQSAAQRADSAYNKQDYRGAIELYQQSLASEGKSAVLYTNLGNAYFRNDNLGRAVLNYERALKLDPADDDARQNLAFVRSRIQDRPEDDSSFFTNLHRSVVDSAKPDTWAWIAFAVFVLLAGAAALYIFSQSVPLRKAGFFGGLVLLFIFAYLLFVAFDSVDRATSSSAAIVTAPSTQLTSAPRGAGSDSDKVVTIHEGTKVEIIDSIATPDDPVSPVWYNVSINHGTKAWLRATDVERI